MNLQNINRVIDVENKHVYEGIGDREGINWENGTPIYAHGYI